MLFTLESVFAKEGDSLILHYGPSSDEPTWILIDGGPPGVYGSFLKPRLDQLRTIWDFERPKSLPLRMVMVSHVDSDHVAGVLDLFGEMETAKNSGQAAPYDVDTLWHNSFDDILGNQGEEIISRLAATAEGEQGGLAVPQMTRESLAVVQSTRQGRNLRKSAENLATVVNDPFEGLIMSPETGAAEIDLGHGLTFTVLGPAKPQVEAYRERWDKDLEKILEKEAASVQSVAFADESPFNLASIMVLAEMGGKRMLLTGDGRGDHLMEGLVTAGLMQQGGNLHVDLLKMPHHGSDRNVSDDFLRRITADHYVISADGHHANPDVPTLEALAAARGDDDYTLHLTFPERAFEEISQDTSSSRERKRRQALLDIHEWLTNERPANCTVVHRQTGDDVFSLHVDLGEPRDPEE